MPNCQEEFSKIYDQFVEKIYRFIFVKVNSQEIAEDLCSDTFLRCWQVYKNDKDNIENIQPFLYKIAKNLVADHYRLKGRAQLVSLENYPNPISDDHNCDIEKAIERKSDIDNIKAVVASLDNTDYRDVLVWRYVDDLSLPEIAEIMDKPEGTVRVMIHRALKAVKNKITNLEA